MGGGLWRPRKNLCGTLGIWGTLPTGGDTRRRVGRCRGGGSCAFYKMMIYGSNMDISKQISHAVLALGHECTVRVSDRVMVRVRLGIGNGITARVRTMARVGVGARSSAYWAVYNGTAARDRARGAHWGLPGGMWV